MFTSKKISGLLVLIMAGLLLSACAAKPTEDPNQKATQIAATVQAELTQIALLTPSATPTPEATATPTQAPATPTVATTLTSPTPTLKPVIGSGGDNSKFVEDVNYPDGAFLKPGEKFTKTWKFQNTGSTTWTTDYMIIYLEGNLLGTGGVTSFKLTKAVAPGETAEISAQFTAPATNGRYTSAWKLYSATGYPFGEFCSIDISVGTAPTGSVTPTTAATATTAPTATTGTP